MLSATLHGTGRLAQRLLHTWLQAPEHYQLMALCDEQRSLTQLVELLKNHDQLDFSTANPTIDGDTLRVTDSYGMEHRLAYSQHLADFIGRYPVWLECLADTPSENAQPAATGKHFLQAATRYMLVQDDQGADQVNVIGLDERPPKLQSLHGETTVISCGSALLNTVVPLAHQIQQKYPVQQLSVSITSNGLSSAICDHMAVQAVTLLPWLSPDQLQVRYTADDAATFETTQIELCFELEQPLSNEALYPLLLACTALYGFPPVNNTAPAPNTPWNAQFPLPQLRLQGNRLILKGYIDNSSLALRYHELLISSLS